MTKIKLDKIFYNVLFVLSFVGVFWSTRQFYIGYNNTDLVHNYQNFAIQINPYLYKVNLTMNDIFTAKDYGTHSTMPLIEYYHLGVKQKISGFSGMFLSGILFIFGFIGINNDN